MKKSVSLRPQMIGVWRSWLSALAWGARGRPFESDHPDSEKKKRHQAMSLFLLWLFGKKGNPQHVQYFRLCRHNQQNVFLLVPNLPVPPFYTQII